MPFELRHQDSPDTPQEVGTLEAVKVKILIQVSGVACAPPAREQITSRGGGWLTLTRTRPEHRVTRGHHSTCC